MCPCALETMVFGAEFNPYATKIMENLTSGKNCLRSSLKNKKNHKVVKKKPSNVKPLCFFKGLCFLVSHTRKKMEKVREKNFYLWGIAVRNQRPDWFCVYLLVIKNKQLVHLPAEAILLTDPV